METIVGYQRLGQRYFDNNFWISIFRKFYKKYYNNYSTIYYLRHFFQPRENSRFFRKVNNLRENFDITSKRYSQVGHRSNIL